MIPLVWNTEKYVHGFISANVADSVTLKIFRQNDYVNFPFQTSQTPTSTTSGENFALRMMLMDKDVFGHTEFEVKDKRLFNYSTVYGDTANAKKFVRFDSSATGNFQSNGSTVNNIMQIVCVTITTQTTTVSGNHCPYPPNQCPNFYTGVPGPCDNCAAVYANVSTTYNTIYHCEIWNEEEGWPSIPNGGGSGGGNPGGGGGNCEFFGSNIINGVVPINCEPGPGGNPWPPVPTQEQLDLQWMQNNIKDSTNNPCVANVLTTLKNISSKLPALMRSVFDTASIYPFDMNIKMQALPLSEGGNTVPNFANFNYQVKLNSVFNDATDLAVAVIIMHEAFHCQLMAWHRQTFLLNDTAKRRELVEKYGYLFTNEYINLDSNLIAIATGPGPLQHQDIAIRYRNTIGEALHQFALAKGIYVSLDYCKALAWSGCQDSRAFLALPQSERDDLNNLISAEKDPYGLTINVTQHPYVGHPCL